MDHGSIEPSESRISGRSSRLLVVFTQARLCRLHVMVAVPSTPIIPFAPPSGIVTFLFTDFEGSTRLWERDRATMSVALERHNAILAAAIRAHGGYHYKTIGDAFQSAFSDSVAAVAACVD